MSFNINGPENKPVIREAQNMMNDGGAGNTGYMMAGKRKKENQEELPPDDGNAKDTFEKSNEGDNDEAQEYENTNSPSLFKKIINAILKFFAAFFEKPPEKPKNKDFLTLSLKDSDKDSDKK